jgi:hypothetical protein
MGTVGTTRRSALLGALAATAAAAPMRADAASGDDPIFSAIETHRAAYAQYIAAFRGAKSLRDEPPPVTAAADAEGEARTALLVAASNATTAAGAAAALRYVARDWRNGGHDFMDLYLQMPQFLDNLAAALGKIDLPEKCDRTK